MANKIIVFVLILITISCAAYASHYDYGIEAFNRGAYDEAVKEFDASLKENPDSIESRFYYALALYYAGRLSEARDEFKRIADKNKDSLWAKYSNSYIEVIDLGIPAPRSDKTFEGLLNISYDSDDNITYSPSLVADGADKRSSAQLFLTLKPPIYSHRPLSFSLCGFGSIYDKNKDYNIYGGKGEISLNFPLLFESFASLSYGSELYYQKYDQYLASNYTEGRVTFNIFPESQAWTSLYAGGANDLYESPTYEVYDGYTSTFGLRQNLSALIYAQYENKQYVNKLSQTRDDNLADGFANRSDEYEIGAAIPFPFFQKLLVSGKYIIKNFLQEDSIGRTERRDASWISDVSLVKNIFEALSFTLRYTATNYRSNLDQTETVLGYGSYLNHVISVSISYKF